MLISQELEGAERSLPAPAGFFFFNVVSECEAIWLVSHTEGV